MQPTLWLLFYMVATNVYTIGPYADNAACDKVRRQIVREFAPKKAACIEIGSPPQMRAPASSDQQRPK